MASVLETFFILFQSNADQVKKGEQEATAAGKDTEAQLGAVDRAGAVMGEHLVATLGQVAAAFVAAFSVEAIAETITRTAELNAQLGLTAQRLGLDTELLYAWGEAAKKSGGSADGLYGSLDFLNRGLADIATKGTSRLKPFFDELKISVTDAPHHARPLLDILGDLSDRFEKMDAQGRAGIGEKLGLDPGIVLMLAQGRRALDDLISRQKEVGVVTEQDTELAHRYERSLDDLHDRLRLVATGIGKTVLPALSSFLDGVGRVIDYLAQHKGLVEGFFAGVAGVVATVYFPAIVAAAAATWAFLAPILAIVIPILAVGAAVALLVDDVQNFLAGNKSVIGEISKTWPVVGETVREAVHVMGQAIGWVVDLAKNGFSLLEGIARIFAVGISAAFHGAANFIHQFTTGFAAAFPLWTDGFRAVGRVIEWFVELLAKAVGWYLKFAAHAIAVLPKAIGNWAKKANDEADTLEGKTPASGPPEPRRSPPGGRPAPTPSARPGGQQHASAPPEMVPKAIAAGVHAAQVSIHAASNTPVAAMAATAATAAHHRAAGDRKVQVNIQSLTVNSQATDAKGVAKDIHGHLSNEMQNAMDLFDDGVQG